VSGGEPDVRRVLDEGPMSRWQVLAVGLCVMLNMIDGFDVLVMSFTAADISAEWRLSGAALGVLLSAGLFGMAAGSLFLAPWADRYGRRTVILLGLGIITTGMLLSALTWRPVQLTALRVITGLGIGGILASLNVITAEYSSRRWRNTAVGLQVTGYPIGATIGGAVAAFLIARHGWRSAFVFGAACSAVMIPVVLRSMPESLDFLLTRRGPRALERLNDVLRRMGRPPLERLPEPAVEDRGSGNPVAALLTGTTAGSTILMWIAFFLLMAGFYFVTSWTPKLLVAAGLSTRQGITGGVLLNLGGIVGGTLFGLLALRVPLRILAAVALACTASAMVVFGRVSRDLDLAFPTALAIGVFLFASMVGLYALTPLLYPAALRATGMGWAIGIGRLGAILAPIVAGVLVDRGWSTSQLYYGFAAPVALALLALLGLAASRPAQP